MGSIRGSTAAGASVRVAPVDGSSESIGNNADGAGTFEFPDVPAGWYILSASIRVGFREVVKAIRVDQNDADAGSIQLSGPRSLRLDCPFQLVTGEVGWPSSIGLTRPSQAPDALREEVEKKRQEVLKSGPPGAQPRPERVVGLYGIFVAPAGLASAPCCSAAVETTLPPARLFGVAEKDLRVIR
jgi:hypothetical protein